MDDTVAANPRDPDTDKREDAFRYTVRSLLLDLSWDTRNERIFAEIARLKNIEKIATELLSSTTPADADVLKRLGGALKPPITGRMNLSLDPNKVG